MAHLKAEKDRCLVLTKGKKLARSVLARDSGTLTGSRYDPSAESSKLNDYQKAGKAIGFCF